MVKIRPDLLTTKQMQTQTLRLKYLQPRQRKKYIFVHVEIHRQTIKNLIFKSKTRRMRGRERETYFNKTFWSGKVRKFYVVSFLRKKKGKVRQVQLNFLVTHA